jgi:curved DNA-binding protein CbpA
MQMRALYEILEIEENASQETIKTAYKRLALLHHPDKHPDDKTNAAVEFRAIHEAYEVLYEETKPTVVAKPSSAAYFQPNLSSEIDKLYAQFPDQLASATFNNKYMNISLSGLSLASAESFKDQIRKIAGIPGEAWMVSDYRDSCIKIGFENLQKTKYFMRLIEKAIEKAFIDSLDFAKAFLQMSKTI